MHWPVLSLSFQFNGARTHKSKDFTLMSFNVDAFQYKQKKLREITNFIENRHPDVVCFQEYRDGLDSAGTAAQYLKKRLGYKHKAVVELIPGSSYGMAFFSKYPITRSGAVTDPGPTASNGIAYADVKLYGQTLRLYNVHLESYKFAPHVRGTVAAPPPMCLTFDDGATPPNDGPKSKNESVKTKTQTAKNETMKASIENPKTGASATKTVFSKASTRPAASAQAPKAPAPKSGVQAVSEKPGGENVKNRKEKPQADPLDTASKTEKASVVKAQTVKSTPEKASVEVASSEVSANPTGRKRKNSTCDEKPRVQPPNASKPAAETRTRNAPVGGLKYYWQIVKELLRTWDKHLEQIYRLSVHRGLIQSDEYDSPGGEVYTVVCGDLNNPPYNYMYRQVRQDLNDAFLERGSGRGLTYGHGLKSFRIDYIFTDRRLDVVEFRTLDTDDLSDHAALFARLRFGFH